MVKRSQDTKANITNWPCHELHVTYYVFKDGATLAICDNCFCHSLKTNKVKYIKLYTFLEREFHEKSI